MKLRKLGQTLIELLIIIGVTAIILPALITGFITSRDGKAQQMQRTQAVLLVQEMAEAMRNIREAGWSNISQNGTYHPVVNGNTWILNQGSENFGDFTKIVEISDVYRLQNGAITPIGGMLDLSTKKVTLTVLWSSPLPSRVESTLYLTRYLENTAHLETSDDDFNSGTKNGVTISTSQDGEIVLGGGGHGTGDWCNPNLSLASLDLPKNGVANSISAIEGQAFAGTGENASGVSFANVNISNDYPPVAAITGTFNCCKTNDIFGESNYAYLATDNNSKEIVIIDISSSTYSEVGYFNAPGNGNGDSVFTVENTGYMVSANKFYIFDITSKLGSRTQLGSVTLAGNGSSIFVVGDYAYVTTTSSSSELQIINIGGISAGQPGNPPTPISINLDSGSGKDVFVNTSGTRAYVATTASVTQSELFIINVTNKLSPVFISNYDSNGMNPKGIRVVTNNKAILVGLNAEEYQVIDITSESNPTRCGGMQVATGINALSSVLESDGDAYSYIVTGDATSEFKIIEGGPSGQYSSSGTFESKIFPDPIINPEVTIANYNRIYATIAKPSQTDIKLQIAVVDGINNSCEGVSFTDSFVGPDGTSNTYFTSSNNTTIVGQVPFSNDGSGFENPGRCMKYKAFLSTLDSSQTPVIYDVSVNYSP